MAQHWYTQQGEPLYEVDRADGKGKRDTTLKDARKLNLVPSVTTIIGQLGKAPLDRWKQLRLLEQVEKYPNMIGKEDSWKDQFIAMSDEENSKYAKLGNEIHNKLEAFYKDRILAKDDEELLKPVIKTIGEVFKSNTITKFNPEVSIVHTDGYGGKIDLIIETLDGSIVLDFKTKQGDKLDSKSLYDDYLMQLSAYKKPLNNVIMCANMLISVTHPGIHYLHIWSDEDLYRGQKMFEHLHSYWKLKNKFMVNNE